jgi:cysteinyl-tRNA synthetase
MRAATARVAGIRETARRLMDGPSPEDMAVHKEAFFDALADDFNTARALSHLAAWVNEANRRSGVGRDDLAEMLGVLGLEDLATVEEVAVGAEEQELLERRQTARAERDFAEADRLRDELRARGFEVRDGPSGPELVPVS